MWDLWHTSGTWTDPSPSNSFFPEFFSKEFLNTNEIVADKKVFRGIKEALVCRLREILGKI